MENINPMKTIYHKCKINTATYFIFLSFLLTGYIKNILLIFLIILIHELGHIFFLNYFHVEIEKVEIYPFGGLTTTNRYINFPIRKEIIIYFGGVFFQILLFFLFFILYLKNIITENTFFLFKTYNTSILLFNLLPIKPLDGGEIFLLFLQKKCSYSKSLQVGSIVSFLFLVLFLFYNIKGNLNNYVIISYLIYKGIDFCKKIPFYRHKFLLERYLHVFPYKKIEHNELQSTNVLKKETLHFFKEEKKYIHERELLKRKFDNRSHF